MRAFNRVLDHLEEWLVASFMGLATIVIFVSVVHRYTADVPWIWKYTQHLSLTWAQELCIYLFIWMAKFGAAYGVRTGIHVGVDVLVNHLPPRGRFTSILVGLLSGALFTAVVGAFGASFVWTLAHTDQSSPDLEAPMWIVYLAIPLGSYLMCFRFLQVAWSFVRTGELPHTDERHVEGIERQQAPVAGQATSLGGAV